MLFLIIVMVLAAAAAGLVVKLVLDHLQTPLEITWKEFGIGATVIALFIAWPTAFVGFKVAKANALSFNEYWNGYETATGVAVDKCRKTYDDGGLGDGCVHDYPCDPRFHTHTRTVSDGDGGTKTETYSETHWHYCPETTEERSYFVDTTLGRYWIAKNLLPPDPFRYEWDRDGNLPRLLVQHAVVPEFWNQAKGRVDSGKPGPVTKRMQYDNYILAADKSILKSYSDKIELYEKAGLLPKVQKNVRDFYYADKVHFVGWKPGDPDAWQDALMYLNAGLGTELQGDLHLVIVNDPRVLSDPDGYLTALKAYWSDQKVFGDDTISKNSIIVVLGTKDGKTVSWARAITGMPLGNEHMLVAIRNTLTGLSLEPSTLIGAPTGQFYEKVYEDGKKKTKVRALHGNGALERIFWGLDSPETKFQRISMTGNDKEDIGGGFLYLGSEIEPTGMQKLLIVFVGFFLSMFVWLGAAFVGVRYRSSVY